MNNINKTQLDEKNFKFFKKINDGSARQKWEGPEYLDGATLDDHRTYNREYSEIINAGCAVYRPYTPPAWANTVNIESLSEESINEFKHEAEQILHIGNEIELKTTLLAGGKKPFTITNKSISDAKKMFTRKKDANAFCIG